MLPDLNDALNSSPNNLVQVTTNLFRSFIIRNFVQYLQYSIFFLKGGNKQLRHCDEMTSGTDLIIISVQNLLQLYPQC